MAAASLALSLGFTVTPALAIKATGGEYNTLYANPGAKGYDVVSYFTDGQPTPGSDRYTPIYGGVNWQFATREHRDLLAGAA